MRLSHLLLHMFKTHAGAGNDYQKDRQFRKLNAQRDAIQIKVIREHKQVGQEAREGWYVRVLTIRARWDPCIAAGACPSRPGMAHDPSFMPITADDQTSNAPVQVLINNTDVVCGDVLLLDTGDKVGLLQRSSRLHACMSGCLHACQGTAHTHAASTAPMPPGRPP